mgnify:CR=1 FL=1
MVNEALLMDLADCGSPERLLGVILDHHHCFIQLENFNPMLEEDHLS